MKKKSDGEQYIYSFKIILIGDSFVGKTSLILRFCKAKYDDHATSTVGLDTQKKYIKRDDKKIELIIWDTAGEERYRSLAKNCCNKMDGVVFVFDLGVKETFKNIKTWYKNLEEIVDFKKVGIVLVGNKCDGKKDVTKDKIMEYAKQKNMEYIATSAKENINVNEIFIKLLDDIINKNKDREEEKRQKFGKISILDEEESFKKRKKCC